ncbi:MAG TPA: CPBP family intramembrane glutamic endopeptidase [Longimicrobium sp.]|uniref:CPBP family intramembrane glutamic endopeptidase n=1 Tax=Longimicrobium sp. TaxID=2029185 RepID=UPI002ED95574
MAEHVTEAAAARSGIHTVLYGPYGLRAGWRILGYLLLSAGVGVMLASIAAAIGGRVAELAGFPVMLGSAVLAGWGMLALVDRRRPGALGFALDPAAIKDSVAGLGIGGAMLGAAVALLAVASMARWVADDGTVPEYVAALATSFVFFAVAAAAEEAVFRGYAFQALVQGVGVWPAMLASSALFAYLHAGNPNVTPGALANIFLAGVMLAVAYLRTRSLWFATAVHLGWNWTMASLLDFPVSGLVRDMPLYTARETGPDWVTGGSFGPEAGIAASLTIVLGTVWMWRTRLIGESPRMRALRPLVDDVAGAEARS